MKKCKFCGKDIQDNMNYCNKDCVHNDIEKRKNPKLSELDKPLIGDFRKAFPESTKLLENNETIYEIKEIMDVLGRSASDGNVNGTHLGKVLSVCRNPPIRIKTYKDLTSYLALVCAMDVRYVKSSYLDGLEVCGVIETITVNNNRLFKWIGIKAFRNDGENKSEV